MKIGNYEDGKIMKQRNKTLKHFRDLDVYQKSFQMAMNIFIISQPLNFISSLKYETSF